MDPKKLSACPYNPAHKIEPARMPFHLTKCKKAHPDVELKECPLNSVHKVRSEKLDDHIKNCPDRNRFDAYKYSVGGNVENIDAVQAPTCTPPVDEDWNDNAVPSYNPLKYMEEHTHILRPLKGATPSQRKKHRFEQRRQY